MRFGTNDPTPWPPELPAGENPPPGAILDYYLPTDATAPVTIEILDGAGRMVRSYSSDDPVRNPDPAVDPVAYNKLCQQTPTAPDCGLPLYWPAPPMVIATRAGMHRVSWDMRSQPIGEGGGRGGGGAAVPHRTYPSVNAPWAAPGSYVVRLTVAGKSYTQPLTLHLDPRVKTPALGLTSLTSLTREMYDGAKAAHAAAEQARALTASLAGLEGADIAAFKEQLIAALAPPVATGGGRAGRGGGFQQSAVVVPVAPAGGGRGGRGAAGGGRGGGRAGAGAPSSSLDIVSASMMAAAMAMQAADAAPTAREVAACADARRQAATVMARWTKLTTIDLAALNAKRTAAGQPAIVVPKK